MEENGSAIPMPTKAVLLSYTTAPHPGGASPLSQLAGNWEVLLQSFLLSVVLFYWVTHPKTERVAKAACPFKGLLKQPVPLYSCPFSDECLVRTLSGPTPLNEVTGAEIQRSWDASPTKTVGSFGTEKDSFFLLTDGLLMSVPFFPT